MKTKLLILLLVLGIGTGCKKDSSEPIEMTWQLYPVEGAAKVEYMDKTIYLHGTFSFWVNNSNEVHTATLSNMSDKDTAIVEFDRLSAWGVTKQGAITIVGVPQKYTLKPGESKQVNVY